MSLLTELGIILLGVFYNATISPLPGLVKGTGRGIFHDISGLIRMVVV
jgi:hypothetical protein